jgi:hypothetical protein
MSQQISKTPVMGVGRDKRREGGREGRSEREREREREREISYDLIASPAYRQHSPTFPSSLQCAFSKNLPDPSHNLYGATDVFIPSTVQDSGTQDNVPRCQASKREKQAHRFFKEDGVTNILLTVTEVHLSLTPML